MKRTINIMRIYYLSLPNDLIGYYNVIWKIHNIELRTLFVTHRTTFLRVFENFTTYSVPTIFSPKPEISKEH